MIGWLSYNYDLRLKDAYSIEKDIADSVIFYEKCVIINLQTEKELVARLEQEYIKNTKEDKNENTK